jgi:DNA-binding NtrC family response regulator
MHPGNILLISDGSQFFSILSRFLTEAGHQVTTTSRTQEAFQLLNRGNIPLVITCLSKDWNDTRPFIKTVRELNPGTAIIILRRGPEVSSPIGAYLIKDGGYNFKPFGWHGLGRMVANCLRNRVLQRAWEQDERLAENDAVTAGWEDWT